MRGRGSTLLLPLALSVVGLASAADAPPPPELASSATAIRPLLPGSPAPQVEVRRADGTPVALAEVVAEGPTVLVFYRGGW